MADISEKAAAPATEQPATEHNGTDHSTTTGPVARPAGWKHKGVKIFGRERWYASPQTQLLMVSMVCFLCPGMFNALTGLGGGGQVDPKANDDANTALYSTFAVVAFFAGTIANVLGVRLTLSFGGIGYCIYAAAFLSYSHNQNRGFVIFAGAFLGVCAGLLWTAQGQIMMAYPPEEKKGRYISWFWMIFNLGAVIGSLIPLGQNVNNKEGPVTDGTYAGFIVLTFLGAILALFLCNAKDVIRDDGSKIILMKNPTWQSEFIGLYQTLRQDPFVILLFPIFLSSNTFYAYQTNDMNTPHFTTRARSLNNVLYWTAQIIGALIFGYCLDYKGVSRSMRAKISFVALTVLTFVIWGGGWAWQKDRVTREVAEDKKSGYVTVDWVDGGEKFIGPMFLYMFYGFYDACWQTCIYWYMGALSNNGRKAANLAGFYKGIQSAGGAIWWAMNGAKLPYNTVFGATWGILAGSLVFAAPVVFLKIKDTVSIEEDLKFSDETIEDVVAPGTLVVPTTKEAEV